MKNNAKVRVIKDDMLINNTSTVYSEQISKIANSTLNNKSASSNVVCFTTDIDTFYNSTILLNTAIYCSRVDKKVLIVDLDFVNKYLYDAVKTVDKDITTKEVLGKADSIEKMDSLNDLSKYHNIEYLSYGNKELFIKEISEISTSEALANKFTEYDIVLVNLPSLLDDSVYLSLTEVFASYVITIKRYKSRIPRINKIIERLNLDNKTIIGNVFDEKIF